MCEIPKMRGIDECYQYLLEQDPETKITKWRFRNLVNAGIIPSTRSGRCILINQTMLPEYLRRWAESMEREAETTTEQVRKEEEEARLPKAATERRRQSRRYGQIRAIQ